MEHREKIIKIIQNVTDLDYIHSKDMEIGIYNWCIEFSNKKNMIKSWKNPRFYTIYIEKSRSVISNLNKESHIKNIELQERLKNKEFLPHELPFMKPEETFPEKWKESKQKLIKKLENSYENKAVAMTDAYLCRKCGKRECSYYELQLKSSDESSTIFVTCINCQNSWRMG